MDAEEKYTKRPNESWWFSTIRTLNFLAFRFWWLFLSLFLLYILVWYFLCLKPTLNSNFYCSDKELLEQKIDALNQLIDNCCSSPQPSNNCPDKELMEQKIDSLNQLIDDCRGKQSSSIQPCNSAESINGGPGFFQQKHNLGPTPGNVNVNYDMSVLPDKLEVVYNGKIVASTGSFVSNSGNLTWYYPAEKGKPTFCSVVLSAPQDGTQWTYYINCPQ